ncbi:hypothetical protein AAFF_G00188420 [Aldrovandia affinis]|uniref:SEA domain-containing protein n=1 Tax=Aldrovandia affinis TaxID=143900 RepID=A0AAD7SY46_9TELE|nr:hypothetical protein AAFF_G00188420 [Aldrovandia affinis]
MNGDIELENFRLETDGLFDNNNSQNERAVKDQITGGYGDKSFHNRHEAAEDSHLLVADEDSRVQSTQLGSKVMGQDSISISLQESSLYTQAETGRHGRQGLLWYLNKEVVWRLTLWMVIALCLLVVIVVVIILSLVLYSVLYVDEDDTFDHKSLVVPRFYSGSMRLNFTTDLLSPWENQSLALSTQLEEKISNLYSASPALGRYFSSVSTSAFRNGSITAYYWLKFLMPLEHEQLVRYTLSQEMVYNVLYQHLYDQEPDSDQLLYIDPATVYMEIGNRTGNDQGNLTLLENTTQARP